ncbi:hypothetical protein [Dyadobacter sp. BHUBP1]|uniref:hypothetical protein n=1 Tax=Dyadobacter sp. BHUBP1 TaxID=3424178 RepID=UPI003D32C752
MCTCKKESKTAVGTPGNFDYVYLCTKDNGSSIKIKVTAGNDNEAKKLAEVECEESGFINFSEALNKVNITQRGMFFSGYKIADNNMPGRVILISDEGVFYSFNEDDIREELRLSGGRTELEIKCGSSAYITKPFLVENRDREKSRRIEDVSPIHRSELGHSLRSATDEDIKVVLDSLPVAGSLASVATHFSNCCTLTDVEENNCAHFLSDAFIKAGYSELKKSARNRNITEWCDWDSVAKSGDARPVRALDMKNWFNSMASRTETVIQSNNGFWAVYQENQLNGQGHVLLYDSNEKIVYGTKDMQGVPYFFRSWRQFFYQW